MFDFNEQKEYTKTNLCAMRSPHTQEVAISHTNQGPWPCRVEVPIPDQDPTCNW